MHQKEFQHWGIEKEKIHFSNKNPAYPKEREIWYVKIGVNVGFEEDGKEFFLRPVLVVKRFGKLLFCVSLTSKGKDNHYFYHKIETAVFNAANQKYKDSSYAILSQARTLDAKRFTENMGRVSKQEFGDIKRKLNAVLL